MGLVYRLAKDAVGQDGQRLIRNYQDETRPLSYGMLNVGKQQMAAKLSAITEWEVDTFVHDIDALANDAQNVEISKAVAQELPALIDALRMVNHETTQGYGGLRAVGAELDVGWLTPAMIGNTTLLNNVGTALLGIYAAANGTRTWTATFVAGTAQDVIPSQQMSQYAGLVHIGAIDTIAVPKLNRIRFTLSGVNTPLQPLNFNHRTIGETADLRFVKFKQSIIAGPLKTQAVTVYPNLAGDAKLELLSILIAKAESLTL